MRERVKKCSLVLLLVCCMVLPMTPRVSAETLPLALNNTYVTGTVTDEKNPALYNLTLTSTGYLTLTVQSMVGNLKWNLTGTDNTIVMDDIVTGGSAATPQTGETTKAVQAGTYTLKVWQNSGEEGSFKVKASLETVASNDVEPNDTSATAMPLAGGQQITGFIGGSDMCDYYKVTAPSAGTFSFDVTTLINNLTVGVYDGSENELKNITIYCNSLTEPVKKTIEVPLKAGTNYVKISPMYRHTSGTYTIVFHDLAATGLQLNTTYLEMQPDEIYDLKTSVTPEGALVSGLKWTSSNPKVITMAGDGRVRSFLNPGASVVTVTATDGSNLSASCTVVVKPGKVNGVHDKSQTGNSIKINWMSQTGVDGYCVYQYNTKKKRYVLYKDVKKKTSCEVKKLKAESKYKFKVCAYVKANGKKLFGEKSSAQTFYTAPKKPGATKITSIRRNSRTPLVDYITVKWKKAKGATSYEVYGKQPGSNYRLLGTSKTTSIVLRSGRGFTYSIKVAPVRYKHHVSTVGKKSSPRSYNSR